MERQVRSDNGNGRMDQAVDVCTLHGRAGSGFATDDREWIDRIRNGSTRALETLFRTHARELTAFAFRYVQSYDAAARVVDEVFARLWRGRHSWAFHGSVRGNLFASAHRVSLEELRRTRSEARWHAGLPATEPTVSEPEQTSASMLTPARNDLHVVMHDTIARLPAVTRTVGFMRWADRLTREEIATVLGSNVRTVHTQITPASRAMRKRLAPTNWVVEKRPLLSTLRDAGDGVDPFPMIDPDRIERYLAGECGPTDAEQLCRDVSIAGGDPSALEAMESAWYGPGRIIADVVDPDTAWSALAHKLSVPRQRAERAGRWTPSLPDATAAVLMVRAVAAAGRRQARTVRTAAVAVIKDRANSVRERASTAKTVHFDGSVAQQLREELSLASTMLWKQVRRVGRLWLQGANAAASYADARVMRALGIIVLGIALTASVWALASKHATAARAADVKREHPAPARHPTRQRADPPASPNAPANGRTGTDARHRSGQRAP